MTAIADELEGASTVLLAEPAVGVDRDVCSTLLADRAASSVLFVSYTRRPDECAEQLAGTGASVQNVGVITVGDAAGTTDRADVESESVSTPSDLTGLGIEIGRYLSEFAAPVVCFDSLTSMLQYVDFETAYEFLHTILGQIHAAGAQAHFHVDPDAHEESTVVAITSLFDASVSVGGQTQVRTRDLLA